MADNSDSSALRFSHCVTLKLSSSNYLLSKIQFETWLNNQKLLGFVNGGNTCPNATRSVRHGDVVTESRNPEFLTWVQNDQKIMGWLLGSLSEDALRSVYGLHTSREIWFSLAKKYNRVLASRKSDLQQRLNSVSKEGKSMAEYLNSVKQICDQLDSIGCPIPENEKIFGVLNGLGKEYVPVTTMIEGSIDTFPMSFEDAVFKLINYEDKLLKYSEGHVVSPHLAFASDTNYSNRGRGGRSGGYRGRNNYSTRGRGFHQQISNGSSSDSGTRPTCQICNKYGHAAYKCYKRFDHAYQSEDPSQAFVVMRVSDVRSNPWVTDSEATSHITNSIAQLQESQPYSGEDSVIVGNGDFLPITHIGSAVLSGNQGNIPLRDVLVCPNITKSLLSVSKLTSDYPCAIEFDYDGVVIKDKQTRQLLTKGVRHNDLYLLENP